MPSTTLDRRAGDLLSELQSTGQYKHLQTITGPMGPVVELAGRGEVVMLCSNNYLGLANHPEVVEAGIEGLRKYGAGTASVRFICGTFECHDLIERSIARLMGTAASLTYVSCWAANGALFPTLVGPDDTIFSDELNHASIIDGCRLVPRGTQRLVYRHNDLADLEGKLKESGDRSSRWVVTDGVFSMEGDLCDLPGLSKLCERYDAMLVVDDSHGTGVLGRRGRGVHEYYNMVDGSGAAVGVDIFTGTLGKALGGAAGGFVAANQRVIDMLIQRSRPSLFSNALPATVACSANKAIEILEREPQRVGRLHENVAQMREGLRRLGYDCHASPTAIIPIIVGDTAAAIAKSRRLLELGVFVIGFGFPVVPQGQARLRVQVSAALEDEHIRRALDAFAKL